MANNYFEDKKGRYDISTVTIETVDQAAYDYFDKRINITVETEREKKLERKKVPVIFATGERWKLVRDKKALRDENGTLILPVITIRRVNVDRTLGFGGMASEQPSITVSSIIHKETPFFQNVFRSRRDAGYYGLKTKDKVIREYLTIPFPDFSQIYYEVTIWTQFQQNMNEILEKIFHSYDYWDSFVMPVNPESKKPKGDGYYFVGFREGDLSSQSNVEEFTDQERILRYTYNFRVPVYLMLDPKNDTLSYGRDEEGKTVVYKEQSAIDVSLKEEVLTLEEFKKLYG